ncbi:MAG TPA: NADP-dependent malic enzyme [Dehalococcoidia bacterium]|nr:NADP-dependent malic enzyme [Dehalococcoidia bacterium]
MDYGAEAIVRHRASRGKLSIASKMKVETMEELSIAYTPGVASVSMAIFHDKSESYALTNRGNTVAVVTDGSAVLGLGNVGPEAAMPVMEGKCILFKALADIDAFPLCLATQDNKSIIETVKNIAPTFGGINLEDIAAPRCFEIEAALQDLGIPVFHDDQHGTSIVVLASIINSLQVVGKKMGEVKIVFSGAGAGGIASAKLLIEYGARNVILVDSQGIVSRDRTDLNPVKIEMLKITNPDNLSGTLAKAMQRADVFVGLSVGGIVTQDMVRSMSPGAAVFAAANPTPEIMPDLAMAAGAAVVGTGRSDFPNQINNSLAFPGVFRGALDTRAPRITNRMKTAAGEALAGLVAEPTPECIIPWSLDKSVVPAVSHAVARAWQAEPGH